MQKAAEGPRHEHAEHAERRESPEAEYLGSRCVLFTYYRGDIGSVVDEHFSRALSAYAEGQGKKRAADAGPDGPASSSSSSSGSGSGSSSSSHHRSFPPSFWDSNYPPPHSRTHSDGTGPYTVDPYSPALHPGLPHPHPHPSESWGYAQSQAYASARPLHELYTPAGLEPHYGPLLMPAVRPAHLAALPGHYDVSKLDGAPSWPGLLPPGDVAQTLALNVDTGVQHHKKGKEVYWF